MTQPDLEPQLRRWKRLALAASVAAGILLLATALLIVRSLPLSEPRLVGTWVCDQQRTMELLRQRMPADTDFEGFEKLYAETRYVYDGSRWTIDVGKGKVEWYRYVVVARDAHSVAIRTLDPLPLPIDHLSEFTVIHFQGDNLFWVDDQVTGFREYYRRAK